MRNISTKFQSGNNLLAKKLARGRISPFSRYRVVKTLDQSRPLCNPRILTRAPSTCIFMNPQSFLFGFRNFPVHTSALKSNLPVHTHPMVTGFTLDKPGLHVVPPYWFIARWDWHYFATSSDSKVSGFTVQTLSDSLRKYFFPLWRADFKNIRIRMDGGRIRK